MKRHGLILFMVALLLLPAATLTLTSCGKQEVITEQPTDTDAEKRKREQEEADRKRQEAETRAAQIKAQEAAEQRAKEKQAREEAAAYAEKSLFLNQHAHFDFDKYNIRLDAATVLQTKAEYLKKYPNIIIQIQGHCDERGTVDYNLALGDRRAHAAAKYLESLGISSGRMKTISYGEERPLNPGHTEDAWAENRRAQVIILVGD